MSLICILPECLGWLKIRNVKKLQQDIENGPIIKDQMADLGYLFVCVFGKYLAPVLVKVIKRIFCVWLLDTKIL